MPPTHSGRVLWVHSCPSRHATATHLIANGTDVRTVAGRLRDASPTMTLDVYAAHTTAAEQAAGQLIDKLLDAH